MMVQEDSDGTGLVAHFVAHASGQPIAALAFDPSGTLVLTADSLGHSFRVMAHPLSSFVGLGRSRSRSASPVSVAKPDEEVQSMNVDSLVQAPSEEVVLPVELMTEEESQLSVDHKMEVDTQAKEVEFRKTNSALGPAAAAAARNAKLAASQPTAAADARKEPQPDKSRQLMPVREWDRFKLRQSRSKSREHRPRDDNKGRVNRDRKDGSENRGRDRSHEEKRERDRTDKPVAADVQEEPPAKLLDDLFRKTNVAEKVAKEAERRERREKLHQERDQQLETKRQQRFKVRDERECGARDTDHDCSARRKISHLPLRQQDVFRPPQRRKLLTMLSCYTLFMIISLCATPVSSSFNPKDQQDASTKVDNALRKLYAGLRDQDNMTLIDLFVDHLLVTIINNRECLLDVPFSMSTWLRNEILAWFVAGVTVFSWPVLLIIWLLEKIIQASAPRPRRPVAGNAVGPEPNAAPTALVDTAADSTSTD